MTEHGPPPPSGEIVGVIIGAAALFIVVSFLPIALTWHRRRRRAATAAAAGGTSSTATPSDPLRRDSALQALTGSPSMQQLPISVERWLEEQTHSGTNETWHYAQESCAICLERLKVDENEKFPTTTTTTTNLPPTQPKPAWIPQRCYHSGSGVLAPTSAVDSDLERGLGMESGLGDWRRGSVPLSLSSSSCSTELDAEQQQQQQQQQHAPTEKQPPQPHPQQDEVVVLNRCDHVFHAACLVLWVEQHRYRCPICQASLKHNPS
ncbi:hypothetical protein ASPACDRAFT_45617 [Aspergillus aculeatus ATCC 16872]|uniref:RING-type domain-containing protein n=1 Tax=Aspergillus aculeatus (strain ATCC 16872 / CBS 172.66 / WB 5094) TaxID=690307 RepID=A0A1L9WMX8_ASPA1|nr:uncharacterized protein ASPACDRAFT_45617 [Aspergillus aculeatus ATCC 16872]OJJ97523.1 hypothetical protein ASPACDRAFT_45617 [Aspergillus aculeatus ATCC 16872]